MKAAIAARFHMPLDAVGRLRLWQFNALVEAMNEANDGR